LSAKRDSAERIRAARIPALQAGHVPEGVAFGAATARGGPQAPPGNCTLLHGVTARGLAH